MRAQTAGRIGLLSVLTVALALVIGIERSVAIPQASRAPQARQSARVIPITDPTGLRRLAQDELQYQGAFRVPSDELNGISFSFGGAPAAFNPDNDSLFIGTHSGHVAEVSIPAPVNSADVAELPFARLLQPFADPSNGRIKTDIQSDGVSLAGLLVHNRRLLGSAVIFYDATHSQNLSHFSRPLTLDEPAASKLVRVWDSGKTGFVAGYMASVPPEWQSRLGGTAVTGQCCLAIINRTSWGPSAFVFDPAEVNAGRHADAQPLVYYNGQHPTLGPWEGSNAVYGATTEVGGMAIVSGTRTALFVGRNGTGPFCYGNGTGDRALADKREGGEAYCYDPTSTDKGQHAYPYHYQVWAYDLSELAEVRAGRRDPWEVKPYGVWPIQFPIAEPGVRIGGVAYDVAGRRLFVAQKQADRDGYAHRPLIHVFHTP